MAPRCRMCPRSAHWSQALQSFTAYCRSRSCENQERLCAACGELFERNVGEAGTKYCSTRCKLVGYRPAAVKRDGTRCAWCSADAPDLRARGGIWPYICQPCLAPIRHVLGRLREHRVPHEMMRRLLTDPSCAVCGRDILTKVPAFSTGRPQAPLVVDHDHSCCAGAKSCGRCVRGLLCGTCNSAAGLLRDDPRIALRMSEYLGSGLAAA
jgi:hypothetical protein